ncbi:TetR/AcrR family transcriptional regulator [Pedosphaera parvula]|nr:TetR/AcrR family transcriptional regulator [Pedosphaera parvula]
MPRSQKQFSELRDRSRQKILASALELFAEQGFGSTQVSAIARKAGVAAGLLYNYFDGKEDLLKTIVRSAQDDVSALVDEILEKPETRDLETFADSALLSMQSHQKNWRVLMRVMLQPEARKVARGAEGGFEKHLARAVKSLRPKTGGKPGFTDKEITEILHSIIIVYIITENIKLARRLIALLATRR